MFSSREIGERKDLGTNCASDFYAECRKKDFTSGRARQYLSVDQNGRGTSQPDLIAERSAFRDAPESGIGLWSEFARVIAARLTEHKRNDLGAGESSDRVLHCEGPIDSCRLLLLGLRALDQLCKKSGMLMVVQWIVHEL
jgi:hypothetical protein